MRRVSQRLILLFVLGLTHSPALAASCGGDFAAFIAEFSREAAAQKVSPRALAALDGVAPDPRVIALDRRQGVFKQSFEQFALPRINARMAKAQRLMAQHAALLARIEQRFGVPGAVIVAIWGLETDFGTGSGTRPAIPALATLAHDCRRTAMFQDELLAALRIIERGDMSAGEMRGAWAGELGQTAVPAVIVPEVRGRFRRQRPARPDPQRAGRARLHRELPQGVRLATRAAVDGRDAEFRGPQGVEQGGGVPEDDRAVRHSARRGKSAVE